MGDTLSCARVGTRSRILAVLALCGVGALYLSANTHSFPDQVWAQLEEPDGVFPDVTCEPRSSPDGPVVPAPFISRVDSGLRPVVIVESNPTVLVNVVDRVFGTNWAADATRRYRPSGVQVEAGGRLWERFDNEPEH